MYHSYLEDEVKKRLAELGVSPSRKNLPRYWKRNKNFIPCDPGRIFLLLSGVPRGIVDKYHVTVVME